MNTDNIQNNISSKIKVINDEHVNLIAKQLLSEKLKLNQNLVCSGGFASFLYFLYSKPLSIKEEFLKILTNPFYIPSKSFINEMNYPLISKLGINSGGSIYVSNITSMYYSDIDLYLINPDSDDKASLLYKYFEYYKNILNNKNLPMNKHTIISMLDGMKRMNMFFQEEDYLIYRKKLDAAKDEFLTEFVQYIKNYYRLSMLSVINNIEYLFLDENIDRCLEKTFLFPDDDLVAPDPNIPPQKRFFVSVANALDNVFHNSISIGRSSIASKQPHSLILFRKYTSMSDIFDSFDLDICKVAYDGENLFVSDDAELAFKNNYIKYNLREDNNTFANMGTINRVIKYYKRYNYDVKDIDKLFILMLDVIEDVLQKKEQAKQNISLIQTLPHYYFSSLNEEALYFFLAKSDNVLLITKLASLCSDLDDSSYKNLFKTYLKNKSTS
jgi:hypothetical protein